MKVDLSKNTEEVKEMEKVEEVKSENLAVARVEDEASPAAFVDDDEAPVGEMKFPRINLVQRIGGLAEVFNAGDIVLDGELVIYKAAKGDAVVEPLRVTVAGFSKTRYSERVEGGEMGNIAENPAEVLQLGGTIDYNTSKAKGIPWYQKLTTALLLVEKPSFINEVAAGIFSCEIEGKNYALATWNMKGSAFTDGAAVLKAHRKMLLRDGYPRYNFLLETKLKKFPSGNSAISPRLHPGTKNSDVLFNYARGLIGA